MRSYVLVLLFATPLLWACSDDSSSPVDAGSDGSLPQVDSGPALDTASDMALVCPTFGDAEQAGALDSLEINEASGLVHSRNNADVLWVHNDSGDTARVFAINAQGKLLGSYALQGAAAIDWEDMAIGSGSGGPDTLYLGDIGDNREVRSSVQLYRVAEPTVRADQEPVTETLQGAEKITLTYPDGAHNAETLLVDPISNELVIITKSDTGVSSIFSTPVPAAGDASAVMTKVGELVFGEGDLKRVVVGLATGGDISADGSEVLLRTYNEVIWWPRLAEESVAEALAKTPCFLPVAQEPQGETVAFSPGRGGYFTLSEGQQVPLHRFRRQ